MKSVLFVFLVALGIGAHAQPWVKSHGQGPVKFPEAVRDHANQERKDGAFQIPEEKTDVVKEDENYLFDRWCWYWSQHLDKEGYIVQPSRTLRNWQAYTDAGGHRAAKTTAVPSNWIFQGPSTCTGGYSGLGRINTVAFDPVDSNTLYIGAAGGGTWKTTDGGHTWASLYDNLPTLGVSDIKVNPRNRNTVFVATGDNDNSDTYSAGVIISHNGGATWSTSGLSWLPTDYHSARSLVINAIDTDVMMIASNYGVYKTTNSGATWSIMTPGDYRQILYNPADTNIVYATGYDGSSAQIMRSVNGGNTWATMTSFTDAQRISIAVCPADPSLVMALASNDRSGLLGVYGSYDYGASYTTLFTDDTSCANNMLGYDLGLPAASCGGQGWYDLCIAINPVDPSQVIIGGVNTYYSFDGGYSWQIVNTWWGGLAGVETVHADKHCLAYNALSGALYECCDGGIYKNYDPILGAWTDLTNGICITEFYRNAVDNGVSFCIGGAQDNGTKMIDVGTSTDLTGGDGMQPLINYGDPAHVFYTSSQNGHVNMTYDGGLNYHSITDTLHGEGAWITPYCLHPSDTQTLVLAYKQVYVTHNNGVWWTPLSPVFDTNYNIGILKIAPTNPNYLYTVTIDYTVWRSIIHFTTNFGASWDTIGVPFTNFISSLAIDPKNEKKFWVTVSGYGTDKVYRYDLTTSIWTDESGTLPDLPVDCIVIDTSSRTKYIGTDAAVFYRDTTMSDWVLYNNHLPSVHVYDLGINYVTGQIWAATYGRGMWRSVKADNVTALGLREHAIRPIEIVPNPGHGLFTIIGNSGSATKNARVQLVSAEGKVVWNSVVASDNSGRIIIDARGTAPGFYICELIDGSNVSRAKVVIY